MFDSHSCCHGTGSTDVRLMDGPGRCAGRVEIQYGGKWMMATEEGWTDVNSNTVCKHLKCGTKRNLAIDDKFSQGSGDFLPKAVKCESNAVHISECISDISTSTNGKNKAVAVTCEGECFFHLSILSFNLPMLCFTVKFCQKDFVNMHGLCGAAHSIRWPTEASLMTGNTIP